MSIRHLAIDLYRAQQKVDTLEQTRAAAPAQEQAAVEEELRMARAELRMLRKMLDGEKETGLARSRSFFGAKKK